MRKISLLYRMLSVVGALLLSLAGPGFAENQNQELPIATVLSMPGPLQVQGPDGQSRELGIGDPIQAGSMMITDETGGVQIGLPGGAVLELGPSARAKLPVLLLTAVETPQSLKTAKQQVFDVAVLVEVVSGPFSFASGSDSNWKRLLTPYAPDNPHWKDPFMDPLWAAKRGDKDGVIDDTKEALTTLGGVLLPSGLVTVEDAGTLLNGMVTADQEIFLPLGGEALFLPIQQGQGGIDTNGDGKDDLAPGDAGYLQAVIQNRLADSAHSQAGQPGLQTSSQGSEGIEKMLQIGKSQFVYLSSGQIAPPAPIPPEMEAIMLTLVETGGTLLEGAATGLPNNALTIQTDDQAYTFTYDDVEQFVSANPGVSSFVNEAVNALDDGITLPELPQAVGVNADDLPTVPNAGNPPTQPQIP